MSRRLPLAARIFFAVLILAGPALAQSGKIAGRVTDAATGEALPGVNVFIEGTTQGTSTNIEGEFIIIGVRPGSYTIVASFIGFATSRREGVRVNVDLTTTVDFALREEVIEGEEIVVTAEQQAVRKDLTSSEARVTAETIDQLPVNELSQVLDVQAGITSRDGIHIRGGRSSEVVVMVDGVPVSDSYDGSQAIQIENDGIEELQVISGTFNAEYGNAMSGIINVVTKEGRGDRYSGSVEAFAGTYAVRGDGGKEYLRGVDVAAFSEQNIQYRDVDPYAYLPVEPGHFSNLSFSLEGPVLSERATFFALGRYFKNDGWLYGARLFNTDGTAGDSSLVPMNTFEKFSGQGNLRVRLTDKVIMNMIGLGSYSTGRDYGLYWRWAPDGRGRFEDRGYDAKLKLTHLLSPTAFYTVNLSSFHRNATRGLYDDPFDARYNGFAIAPPDTIELVPGSGEFVEVVTGGTRFARGGTDLGRLDRTTNSYMLKADLSSQLGRNHLVKTGFLARLDRLSFRAFGLIPAVDPETGATIEPFEPALPPENSSQFNNFDDVEPITLSAYIQDKMEFESFIVNAGIRFDYFDARSVVPADPEDPNIFNPLKKINRFRDANGDGVITEDEETPGNALTVEDREAYWWTDTEPEFQVSPRLGVAYPISELGVIHFSFGLFFQIPTLNNLFDQFGYKVPISSGTYGPFGNPNLKAQKTTMYEIGFKQGFGDFVIDVTGYYRDVRNWVSTSVAIPTEQPGVSYVVYTNRDYANTRGLTLSFKRQYTGGFGFDANYTFQVVEGSNSNPGEEFIAIQNNAQPKLALLPLNWDQRHKVAGALYTGGDGWGGSLRMRFESGFPYTPFFNEASLFGSDVPPEFPQNSRRMASTFELDLSAQKSFTFGPLEPRLFLEVFNLFDARNVANVFADTGEPDLTLFQIRSGDFDPGYFVRPEHYREPRRVQLGLEFRF